MTSDLFRVLHDVKIDALHKKFLLLKNEILMEGERRVLLEWTKGFQDRDNKIIKEFQTTFHSAFWEFYLNAVLNRMNCTIDFSKDRPDFIVAQPHEFYMEAVIAEIKNGGRSEDDRRMEDILSMGVPPWEDDGFIGLLDEAITRYSNAIRSKRSRYVEKYSKLAWVKPGVPFVIAMSSYSQVKYGKEYNYPMLALLYGMYFDPRSKTYRKASHITKPGTDASIPIGIFDNEEMKDVSAVVFSCVVTLGKLTSIAISEEKCPIETNFVVLVRQDDEEPLFKIQLVDKSNPEDLFDGLFVFHNPNARVRLSREVFANTSAIQVHETSLGIAFEGGNLPLVSRLNLIKFEYPEPLKSRLIWEIFSSFNAGWLEAQEG